MSEDVGKSKLVVGMLRSADIANNLLDAINFQNDLNRMADVYSNLVNETTKTLKSAQNLSTLALKDGYSILSHAIKDFPQSASIIIQMQRNQLMQSGAGFRMTASLMGQQTKMYSQNNYVDLFGSLIYDMPETFIREKVKRFYNEMYRIGTVDTAFATKLYNKKKISETDWKKYLAQSGVPDKLMPLILDDVDVKPAIGTALRMYQFIDIDDKSLIWLMNENGITMPQVQQLWLRYFHANRLRDEMAMYKNYLIAAYQDGLITEAQLKSEFAVFKASKEETDRIAENQKSEFLRRITRMETETRLWLYRKGVFGTEGAEEELYAQLSALSINTALVNAMVRLEAAKKGIDWEKA